MSQQQMVQQGVRDGGQMVNQMDEFVTISITEIAKRLVSAWKLLVCMVLIFALVAGVYTSCFVTPLYKATSVIYVLNNSDSVINAADLQLGTALTHDYIKLFQMWEVHEAVISELNLPYSYQEMKNMLSVTNSANTRMLDITITATSGEEAATIADAYAEIASAYIAETMATDKPNIVSTALVPKNPSSPSLVRNVIIMGILGMLIACAYVVACFMMDDKYKSAEDIRMYTGWTTLAVVPIEQNNSKKNSRRSA